MRAKCSNLIHCLEGPKINEKEAGDGLFFKYCNFVVPMIVVLRTQEEIRG